MRANGQYMMLMPDFNKSYLSHVAFKLGRIMKPDCFRSTELVAWVQDLLVQFVAVFLIHEGPSGSPLKSGKL